MWPASVGRATHVPVPSAADRDAKMLKRLNLARERRPASGSAGAPVEAGFHVGAHVGETGSHRGTADTEGQRMVLLEGKVRGTSPNENDGSRVGQTVEIGGAARRP